MINIKYLEKLEETEAHFMIVLKEIAMQKTAHIQKRIALSLFEDFNGGTYVDENDILLENGVFSVPKAKYPRIGQNK